MAVLKLWNIHFDWLGLEKLHICVYSHKQGMKIQDAYFSPMPGIIQLSNFESYMYKMISHFIFIFLLLLGLSS